MQNIHRYSIILSFFGLWLVSVLSVQYQTYVGFFCIFTFGIIHGTNDLVLISKLNDSVTVKYGRILATYIIAIFVTIALYKFWPFTTLLLFICFSAYHFGEQHFDYLDTFVPKLERWSFQFLYGLFVLSLLFYQNDAEVITIINEMTAVNMQANFFFYLQFVIGSLLVFNGIYIGIKSSIFFAKIIVEIFFLLIFVIIFKSSTLIWGFALYFILWHSVPSILSQVEFIHGQANKSAILQYLKTGLIFWIISMFGMVIIFLMFKDEKLFYTLFFSFIIAITVPHVVVIQKMFSRKSELHEN